MHGSWFDQEPNAANNLLHPLRAERSDLFKKIVFIKGDQLGYVCDTILGQATFPFFQEDIPRSFCTREV